MKSKSVLECAVFQLTPTRTRCDLYIIANDKKKEKIASGLLSPFIAHLKSAQHQIAQGGYSVFLTPPPASPWFTKSTLQSFVRFVSTPEILERVYTIESEILQIQDAISIQGNNDILQIQDQHVKPVPSSGEGNKHACDADEGKAIVLYKPGVQETNSSGAKEGNSKVQLLNVLETRKTVLKKEQGMAFARAVAAGFEVDHLSNLLSFAECFGASRLMNACLRFMDLWKQKHESGQWVEIEAEDAMSTKSDYSAMNASGIVLSSMTNRHDEPGGDANSESKETEGTDSYAGGQQQYQFPHPAYPPWGMMHSSSPGSVPVYQPYPMPYYQQHYSPGTAPFYPPPPYPSSMEDPHFSGGQRRQSMDNRYTNSESEDSEQHKNAAKSSKKKSGGRVVIRNINYITSKKQNSSEDESESASVTHTDGETERGTHKRSLRSPKRKQSSESETHNRKETDSSHWQAFQSFLLKGAEEGERSPNKDMFAMEKDHQTKRRQKQMADDPLVHAERDADGNGHRTDMQSSYERNGRKTAYRGGSDDFIVGGRDQANVRNPLALNGFETNLDRNGMPHPTDDETVMVSLRSTAGGNDNRSGMNMDYYDLPSSSQNPDRTRELLKYEPDALSLMPERAIEKRSIGYDPALDYEMQLAKDAVATSREKNSKTEAKKGSKSAEKHQQLKPNQRSLDKKFVGKGKPSTLEDARARAEKLRSFKADLQKMKKEQHDAEQKRLEALKIERQKRIAARANSMSGQPGRKQLASKITQRGGSKFTDSEPGSSSPLQRSKIRTTTVGSTINSKKPSTSSSKIVDRNHSAGNNRLTRSLSSMSDRKKEIISVTPDSKVSSITHIRRLSEPKKITSLKTRSAEPVSKPKLSNGGPETKKKSAIMSVDQSKAASLPELKIKTSSNLSQKLSAAKVKEHKPVAKLNLNDRLSHQADVADVDNNPIIDKSVVMLEDKQPSISYAKEVDSNHEAGASSHAEPLPMEIIDKGTISVQPHKHPTPCEVRENFIEETPAGTSSTEKNYQAPYARVSSFEDPSTRNSEYAKAPQVKIPEVVEKPQSKGFRRLLKLGKKSHSPSDTSSANATSDNGTFTAPASASTEVNTLKTLISEDQTPTHGHASQKSSRHFSLLSSLRGKTTEKKPST
nr:hypothetical protein [Tanacetum cinerariifolium]